MNKPSEWQQSIQGQWYGNPSVFDAEGNCVGHIKVDRSSVFEGGRTTYFMDTKMDVRGPLRARFEAQGFAFGVRDSDQDRVYLGPDFVGAGHPYGTLVDAHYYSPGWTADLKTMVHILPDGQTQVYSSLLYDGPTIVGVFNGLYKVASDYDVNKDTSRAIDQFLADERAAGPRPHVLPFKHAGQWTGVMAVYDAKQQRVGDAEVAVDYRPLSLLRAAVEVRVTGAVEFRASYQRSRIGNRHVYEGPDVFGNAIGYGRALYTSQHFYGKALKIRGREFLLDDNYGLSAVWHVHASDKPLHMMFGKLDWRPGELVLPASYGGEA
jgi:hypothetical protein